MLRIEKLLPGYNCGECGLSSCREFASKLVDVAGLERCPLLKQGRFRSRAEEIARLLSISHQSEGNRRSSAFWMAFGPILPSPLCLGSHPVGRIYIPSIPLSGWMRGDLPLPATGLPHHSFCQGSQIQPGRHHCSHGWAGASAAGTARTRRYWHMPGFSL